METNRRKNELFANAMSNLMNGNLGVSIDLLDELIKVDSNDRLAWLARGSVYLKMGNSQNAISDFNQAIELNSSHPKAYHLRGLAREISGDNDEALADFTRALDIDPEAAEDMKMVAHLTDANLENFANENNIWRSRHMQVEGLLETEMNR